MLSQSLFAHYTYGVEEVLPPDEVRLALSVLSQAEHRFAVGLMDDATEAMEKMLALIHDEVCLVAVTSPRRCLLHTAGLILCAHAR